MSAVFNSSILIWKEHQGADKILTITKDFLLKNFNKRTSEIKQFFPDGLRYFFLLLLKLFNTFEAGNQKLIKL